MKNLFITMSCFATILLTSSCTADSPVKTKTENQSAPPKIIDPGAGGVMATGDDKDKSQG